MAFAAWTWSACTDLVGHQHHRPHHLARREAPQQSRRGSGVVRRRRGPLLPQFIPPGSDPGWVGTLLAMVHNVERLLWFALLLFLVNQVRDLLQRPAVLRWIDGVVGAVVVGCGVVLGLETR